MKVSVLSILIGVLLFIIGCGSAVQTLTYRPKGSNEKMWNIHAEKNTFSNNVEVFVNDSLVTECSIGIFESGTECKGEYLGHPVLAMLDKSSSFLGGETIKCLIMIDGELVGKVEW